MRRSCSTRCRRCSPSRPGSRRLYLGGGSMGYIKAGTKANLSLTEMAQAAVDIRTVCTRAADPRNGACGWGRPDARAAHDPHERGGRLAAIEIEDQILPKRAHHHIGREHMAPCRADGGQDQGGGRSGATPISSYIGRTNAVRNTGPRRRVAARRRLQKGRLRTCSMSAGASRRICASSASASDRR